MSKIGPYGHTEAASDRGVVADALTGKRDARRIADAVVGASATGYSTAPYVPPSDGSVPPWRPTLRYCARCGNQWAIEGSDYCRHHQEEPPPSPSKRCAQEGCNAWAMNDRDHCRHHGHDDEPPATA